MTQGATTSGSRSARLQTDQRAKDDNADRNASRPGTYAANRKTLDFSPPWEVSIGTTARMMLDQGCLEFHTWGRIL